MEKSTNQLVSEKKQYVKHPPLVLSGYKYRFLINNKDGTQRYTCSKENCNGRVTVSFNGQKVSVKEGSYTDHNTVVCVSDPTLIHRTELVNKFLTTLKTKKTTEKPSLLFNRLRNEYPTTEIGGLNYSDVKNRAKRMKSKIYPQRPSSLAELGASLQGEGMSMLFYDDGENGSQLIAKTFTVNELTWPKSKKNIPAEFLDKPTSTVVILGDRNFVKNILKDKEFSANIYTDGTFSINMNDVDICQTYIVQVEAYNQAWPIAYVLMERKTKESYVTVFQYIFDHLAPELKSLKIKAHMDFEAAVHTTIKEHFPFVEIIACLFHFDQAQTRQSKKKGALVDFKKTTDEETDEIKKRKKEISEVLRLVQLVPYLPPEKIDSSLLIFLKNRLEDPISRERVEKYFQYVDKNWINNLIWPPTSWSVYGQDHATNNFSESRNKNMTLFFGRHPYPYVFIENLTVYQGKIKRDFEGTKKPRQSYKVSRKKRFIRGCERELEEGMERIEFLIKIAGWENDKQIKESAFEKLGEIDSDSEENNSGTENTMNEKIGDTVPEDAVPKESHNSKRCKNESEDSICKKKQKRQERSESRDDIPRRLTRSMTVKPTP